MSNWLCPRYRRIIIVLVIICIILPTIYFLLNVCIYTDYGFICQNTASRKGYRQWIFGIRSNQWNKTSPLEVFMCKNHTKELSHRWVAYFGDVKNIFGMVITHDHGSPGPILYLSMLDDDVLPRYCKDLTSPQMKALYDMFSTSDKKAIESKVEEITNYYMFHLAND